MSDVKLSISEIPIKIWFFFFSENSSYFITSIANFSLGPNPVFFKVLVLWTGRLSHFTIGHLWRQVHIFLTLRVLSNSGLYSVSFICVISEIPCSVGWLRGILVCFDYCCLVFMFVFSRLLGFLAGTWTWVNGNHRVRCLQGMEATTQARLSSFFKLVYSCFPMNHLEVHQRFELSSNTKLKGSYYLTLSFSGFLPNSLVVFVAPRFLTWLI